VNAETSPTGPVERSAASAFRRPMTVGRGLSTSEAGGGALDAGFADWALAPELRRLRRRPRRSRGLYQPAQGPRNAARPRSRVRPQRAAGPPRRSWSPGDGARSSDVRDASAEGRPWEEWGANTETGCPGQCQHRPGRAATRGDRRVRTGEAAVAGARRPVIAGRKARRRSPTLDPAKLRRYVKADAPTALQTRRLIVARMS
jgi:hypothetical protein